MHGDGGNGRSDDIRWRAGEAEDEKARSALEDLVHEMPALPVQPVEARGAVMDGVQLPKNADPVARAVDGIQPEIDDDERQHELDRERKPSGPQRESAAGRDLHERIHDQ